MSWFSVDRDIFNECDYNCQARIKPNVRNVHIYLISLANYKQTTWNNELIDVGECVVSQDKIAEKCFITRSQVRTALRVLEKDGYIVAKRPTKKIAKRMRIIKVIKYRVSLNYSKKSSQENSQNKDGKVATSNNLKDKYIEYPRINLPKEA